jgi:hypothetical protein
MMMIVGMKKMRGGVCAEVEMSERMYGRMEAMLVSDRG